MQKHFLINYRKGSMIKGLLVSIVILQFFYMLSFSSEVVIFKNGKYLEIDRYEEDENHYLLILKAGEISCEKSAVKEIRKLNTKKELDIQSKGIDNEVEIDNQMKDKETNEYYAKIIKEISGKYDIDPYLVEAIIKVESNYNPKAISPKGAKGIMQLMPETADRFQAKDIFNVQENIETGIKYLKFLFEKYNERLDLVLAAYNAGEKAVDQYNGIPPYQETVEYIVKVCDIYGTM